MRLRPVFSALVASVLCTAIVQAAPIVVYGNLGPSGTNSVGGLNNDLGPSVNDFVAQGFVASSPNLSLQSVSLVLFGNGSIATKVGIYADNAGVPAAVPLFTSSTVNVGPKSTYSFSFTGVTLGDGVKYWVSPDSDVSWYLASSTPTAQNLSGYSYGNTAENTGSGWGLVSDNYSISITASPAAVPEIDPAGFGSVAALIAGMAGLLERRRQRVVARAID